jgi:TrmH family RNA methyltransferase
VITSRDNAALKLVRKLAQKKHRVETGLFAAEGEDLVEAARAAGIEPVELLVAGETVTPELLAGVSKLPHPARAIGIYRAADLPRGGGPLVLGLWRLADPGNVGTLLRTADAFDAGLALSPGCADVTGPKALRASAGAVFRVPTSRFDDAPRPWVAVVSRGGSPRERVLGHTCVRAPARDGLPDDVIARCETRATIALAPHAESLNVAAAGAIALYAARRH